MFMRMPVENARTCIIRHMFRASKLRQEMNQGSEIPGLYNTDQTKVNPEWSNNSHITQERANLDTSYGEQESGANPQQNVIILRGKSLLSDLILEKESLDQHYAHSHRLLESEIARVKRCGNEIDPMDKGLKQRDKIYVSMKDQKQHNLLGRLLGPKGATLKRMQIETQTKMSILGRGSIRDRAKEEELRSSNDPNYEHLKDDLHVLIEANPPHSHVKLAAGMAEVKKMLIPLEPGMQDIVVAKFLDPMGQPQSGGYNGPPQSSYGNKGGLLPSPRRDGRTMRGGGGGGGSRRGGGMRGNGRSMRGGGKDARGGGGGGGGGPMRTRPSSTAYDSYDRHQEYPEHRNTGGYGNYESRGGYGERGVGAASEGSYGRSDPRHYDSEPHYGGFSDSSRNYPVSRDYNHGSGDVDSGARNWGSSQASKRDYRHHPYQQQSSYGNY